MQLLDFETISLLTQTQKQTENFTLVQSQMLHKIYENLFSNSRQNKVIFMVMLRDLMNYEEALLKLYDDYAAKFPKP